MSKEYVMSALESTVIDCIWGAFVIFWVLIVSSWLYSLCIKYITDGDKIPDCLCKRVITGLGLEPERHYYPLDSIGWIFIFSGVYMVSGGIASAIVYNGGGQTLLIFLLSVLSLLAMLKISKFVYGLNKRFNNHADDKDAHN